MNECKTAVFVLDFDGVITSLDIDWTSLRKEVEKTLNLKIDTLNGFFERTWGRSEFGTVSDLVKECELLAIEKSVPYPDVKPALQLALENNCCLYIASMQSITVLDYFLRKYEMSSWFKQILGRESAGSKKAQLQRIAEEEIGECKKKSSVQKKKLVLIEDSYSNISSGNELGYASILFKRKQNSSSLVDIVKQELLPNSQSC